MADGDRRRGTPARRRRVLVEAVVLVLACGAALWGIDVGSRLGAESLLERNLQEVTGVQQRPQVTLGGGFFLPQVLRGAYDDARVDVVGLRTGPLTVERLEADLSDVRLPLKDLVLQDVRRVGIGHSAQQVTLRFDDLNAYFATTGRDLTLAVNEDNRVALVGSFGVLGQTVPVSARVALTVDGSQLRITPSDIDTGDVTLGAAGRLLLDQRIALTVPLDGLPFGSELTDLTVSPEALLISAESTGIVLQP